jgi:5-methylthioribose kinase
MREITAETAAVYLRESGRIPSNSEIAVRELTGGVSNIVMRIDVPGRPPFVLKQCRERLRVAMDWRARLDRIWTEYATLQVLGTILPQGTVPDVLFEDRANYLFAMTCAPDDAVTWKSHLMAGQVDQTVSARLGTTLATIHSEGRAHPALRGVLADTSLFDELRIDPYYRTIARLDSAMAPHIDALIAAMRRPEEERTLVLGDFSPKNILVHNGGLTLLDFECAHGGDPAFDLGFFLSHLLLKLIRAAGSDPVASARYSRLTIDFWSSYLARRNLGAAAGADLIRRAGLHTAACCWARVDGKSPVEYLDRRGQSIARSFGREALRTQPAIWDDLRWLLDVAIDRELKCRL